MELAYTPPPSLSPAPVKGAELAIVAPTFNEQANVRVLIESLDRTLKGISWEIIFVDDDSKDGTLDVLRLAAREDARVRVIHRIGRRGLSSAVVEGVQATNAPWVAVMDADLQHDESILPHMLDILKAGDTDVVVGSRYVSGGGIGDWDASRARMSSFATRLAGLVSRQTLSDPMSGFFMMKRETFDSVVRRLSTQGYKILLDILASSPTRLRVVEAPYTFRKRSQGESKLDSLVVWEYLMLLLDKLVGHIVPVRFIMFMLVGGTGVFVHMAVLAAAFSLTPGIASLDAPTSFMASQTIAAMAAMTFNFFINNILTYRDKRLKGGAMWIGLLTFYLVCSVGAVANVGIASALFRQDYAWWLSAIGGILVGAVWNYAASAIFTWRKS